MLTKNRDTDFIVLNQLKDYELTQVCQANKYVNSLCNDDIFWMNRVLDRFGIYLGSSEKIRTEYLTGRTWKEYYMWLREELSKFPSGKIRIYGDKYERFNMLSTAFWKEIEEEDLLKLLNIKMNNRRNLLAYAKEGDLDGIKELFQQEDFLLEKRRAYITNSPELIGYLLQNNVPFDKYIIDDILHMEYYTGLRELIKSPKFDIQWIMPRFYKPKIAKIAIESGRLTEQEYTRTVYKMLDNVDLSFDQIKQIYQIISQ